MQTGSSQTQFSDKKGGHSHGFSSSRNEAYSQGDKDGEEYDRVSFFAEFFASHCEPLVFDLSLSRHLWNTDLRKS